MFFKKYTHIMFISSLKNAFDNDLVTSLLVLQDKGQHRWHAM